MILNAYSYLVVSVLIGLAYPAYCSTKALRKSEGDEHVQWLAYWVIYAILDAVDFIPDFLIGAWMPLYFELKIFTLLWLAIPTFNRTPGATQVYRLYMEPWLEANEGWVDESIEHLKQVRLDTLGQHLSAAQHYVMGLLGHKTAKEPQAKAASKEKPKETPKKTPADVPAPKAEEAAETNKNK
ncbi:hypothetical protein AB1Y20_001525 [Prymnesium parvum]|uniref:Receptor expression-enhancing protein n=1 Tax=Prymnesium parvum TaxID=97485 RepID=A0AB34K8G8_PRYPA